MFLLVSRVVELTDAGEKVWLVGDLVAVAVAKKDVVGEYCVDVGEVGGDVAAESAFEDLMVEEVEEVVLLLSLPEEIIWWFVGQMKIGRPIVSFARVSIFIAFVLLIDWARKECWVVLGWQFLTRTIRRGDLEGCPKDVGVIG